MWRKIMPTFLVLMLLVLTGLGCKGGDKQAQQAFQPVKLTYWRVFDDEDSMADVIAAYNRAHPNISIEYKKLRFEEYQKELLNALAEDRGPDIFTLHNTWVGEYIPKLSTAPSAVTLPYAFTKGTLKKETVIEFRTTRGITVPYVLDNFVDQVAYDVIWTEKKSGEKFVFGVPLALDTMVMFYNKDLLNNAGIPTPPKSWSEFQQSVKKIVRLDTEGNILLAGAPIGTSRNVERSTDILSLLMMQNGAIMETDDRAIQFHVMPPELKEKRVIPPGFEALQFYIDFASPTKEVYTWSDSMPDSFDAFVSGKSAFFFGYSYHIPLIRQQAPKLNFAVGKMPQIGGNEEVNFANYFVEVVSKKSKHRQEAWDFLKFASSAENVELYLDKVKKPTALRALVLSQLEDIDLATFASQVLTAKSWYKGYEPLAAEEIMKEMIDTANKGEFKLKDIVGNAAAKVQQTTFSRQSQL